MPPWLPEAGYGQFAEERRLTSAQIDLIQRWVGNGSLSPESLSHPTTRASCGDWSLIPGSRFQYGPSDEINGYFSVIPKDSS
jgi:hypothetical protein